MLAWQCLSALQCSFRQPSLHFDKNVGPNAVNTEDLLRSSTFRLMDSIWCSFPSMLRRTSALKTTEMSRAKPSYFCAVGNWAPLKSKIRYDSKGAFCGDAERQTLTHSNIPI